MSDDADDPENSTKPTPDDPGDDGDDSDDGDTAGGDTLADMTVADLADGLEERGFVTVDDLGDEIEQRLEASKQQRQKADLVDEIIAHSDAWDDDEETRETLLTSPTAVLEREHDRAMSVQAAQLPGTAGRRSVQAGQSDAPDGDEWAAPSATERAAELAESGGDD